MYRCDHGFADGDAVIDETEAAVAGARIVEARLEVVVGQLDQRIVLAQSHGLRGGRDAGDGAGEQPPPRPPRPAASAVTWMAGGPWPARAKTAAAPAAGFVGEGQRHFDFGVLGERLGARQVEGAACRVDAVDAGAEDNWLPAP